MLQQSLSELETAVALLAWQLRAGRMTPMEHAAYTNGLVRARPVTGIEARADTLIQEIRNVRQAIET